jgi:hypothetical protein
LSQAEAPVVSHLSLGNVPRRYNPVAQMWMSENGSKHTTHYIDFAEDIPAQRQV